MASGDVSTALDCSVCLNIYSDPVNLKCGHSFCRVCIDRVLDTQAASGVYLCPECRDEFAERPVLHKSLTLCNLVKDFLSSQSEEEKMEVVFCTYCIESAEAAVMCCVLCEACLCKKHLRVHSQTPEHVLSHLPTSPDRKKCSIHKKLLQYYCTEDAACICASCKQDVEHRGHQVEALDQAAEKKKHNLKCGVQTLMTKVEDTRTRLQELQKHRKEAQQRSESITQRIGALSGDIRGQVEDLDKKASKLEAMKGELLRKMRYLDALCDTADPLTVLQDPETGDLCDPEEGKERDGAGDLDVTMILYTLGTLSDIAAGVKRGVHLSEPAHIFLDENTAGKGLQISGDGKIASLSTENQVNLTKQRFESYPQVLSSKGFSLGRHYWEVDVWGSERWSVGVSYPSIDRHGVSYLSIDRRGVYCQKGIDYESSQIGRNNKSWCLETWGDHQYSVVHNKKISKLPGIIFIRKVRVYVDLEAGQVSFYQLCHPIRHLHTFTATFTEPLYAALGVHDTSGCIKLSEG